MIGASATVWAIRQGAPKEAAAGAPVAPAAKKKVYKSKKSGIGFIHLAAGEFLMGSEKDEKGHQGIEAPKHRVTFTKSFYMGVTPVTQGQWKKVMGTTPWEGKDYVDSNDENAVSYVSWDMATEFCEKLAKAEGKPIRLPTAAEWECACRAGTDTAFSFGDDPAKLPDYGWFEGNCRKPDNLERYAHPVLKKKPNPWGFCDFHGNVREWVFDWFKRYKEGHEIDPREEQQADAQFRTIRGGSWFDLDVECRSAMRDGFAASKQINYVGFRVAMDGE